MNVKAISKNVGQALLVSSFFMFASVVVSLFYGKDSAFGPLLTSALITFIVGVFPQIFVNEAQPISLKDGFVIIVLAWFLSFVFGMMPYVMWGGEMSFVDAWFESVSGFTTTGATILNDIEALPRSLLFWRGSTHFIGGLGVVVFLLLIIPSASSFRSRLTKMEVSSLSKEGYHLQSQKLVKVIVAIYVSIFLSALLAFVLCGMPLFDAVTNAFSVCATGGFCIRNASFAFYDSYLINIVAMFFMIVATTNFALTYTCISHRSIKPLLRSHVFRFYIGSIFVISCIVALSLRFQGDFPWAKAILDGVCTTVSYITTTGFGFCDNARWPFLASIMLVYASIQCATAGSTSSGLKVDRIIVMFKSISRQIKQNLHPTGVKRIQVGELYFPEDQVLPIALYIVLYFIIAIVSICLLLICGVGGLEAISGSFACLSNVGPALGNISVMGNYDYMPSVAKVIYTLDMFLGRLEIYPLLIVFSLIFKRAE